MKASTELTVTGERRSGPTLLADRLNATEGLTVSRVVLHIAGLPGAAAVDNCVASLTLSQRDARVRHSEGAAIARVAERRQTVGLLSVSTQSVHSGV